MAATRKHTMEVLIRLQVIREMGQSVHGSLQVQCFAECAWRKVLVRHLNCRHFDEGQMNQFTVTIKMKRYQTLGIMA